MTNDNWKAGLPVLALLAGLGVFARCWRHPIFPGRSRRRAARLDRARDARKRRLDRAAPTERTVPRQADPLLLGDRRVADNLGMSEAAVRCRAAFGMLGTLTTAAIAWRILGRRTGLIAGVFYASMILPLALVQLPAHDVGLVPWVNLALLCLWESDSDGSSRRACACIRSGPRRPARCWG